MSTDAIKLQSATSQLVIVDMQVKLSLAMPETAMQSAVNNTAILLQAAHLLNQPVIVTEQYPKGLGHTLPALQAHWHETKPIEKTAFSACAEPKFIQKLHRDASQVVLTGMEAHICVLQTALDLIKLGKQVFVVEDAILSRAHANQANAIARLRQAGCIITNTESVVFEWLGNAKHAHFKAISALIK